MSDKLREYAEKVAESKGWCKEAAELLTNNIRKEEVVDARAELIERLINEAAEEKIRKIKEAEKKKIEQAFAEALER